MKTTLSNARMFADIRDHLKAIEEALYSPQFVVRNWIDQEEICRILKVTPRTLSTYREKGLIPYSHLGGKYFYRLSDIEKHLDHATIGKDKKS